MPVSFDPAMFSYTEDTIQLTQYEVLGKLPMEFAVEARKLLQVSLEGSVG